MANRPAYRTNTGVHIEWFTVRRSTVWAIILTIVGLAGAGYFAYLEIHSMRNRSNTSVVEAAADNSARFLSVKGNVKVRQAGTYEWIDANTAMRLTRDDTIRTVGTATARVRLFDGTEYLVKPDTILVIEEAYEDPTTKAKRVAVKLTAGQVNLKTPRRSVSGSRSDLQTPTAEASFDGDTTADIRFDSSNGVSGFTVLSGRTSLTAGGKNVTLNDAQAVNVSQQGFSTIVELPGVPAIDNPTNLSVVAAGKPLEFRWRTVKGASRYNVMIDRTPNFVDPILESSVKQLSLLQKSLPVGTYYWQVNAIDSKGRHGAPSDFAKFTVSSRAGAAADSGPAPKLSMAAPDVSLDGVVTITGRTESDVFITVDVGYGDEKVVVKDGGAFAHYFTATRRGKHKVVVKARRRDGGKVATKTVYADVGTGR